MRFWRGTVIAVLALALGQAGTSRAAQRKEDMILAELRQIQAQLAQLQTSHSALKKAIEELRAQSQDENLRKTLADSKVVLERLQQDLSILSARVDETNGRIGNLREEVASMRQTQQPLVLPPIEPTEEEGGGATAAVPEEGPGEAPPPLVAAGPTVTDIYNQARIDYTQGRYPLAISGFKEVLDVDPEGDLADNAHYWMGESHIAQRQYDSALEEFDIIIRNYPDSNKRPDAYLKKAMTLELMDRRSEAMLMYELVIEQFPRSPQQRVARRKLEELMMTTPPR